MVVVQAIQKGGHPMNRRWLIGSMLALLGVLMLAPSVRAGELAKFEGGIGVIPVVAGGDSSGTPDGVTLVAATLFCQTSPGPPPTFSAHSSGAHPLAADGDFKFKDTLTPVPPSPCTNPALLIRANNSNGPWLAAGIPH